MGLCTNLVSVKSRVIDSILSNGCVNYYNFFNSFPFNVKITIESSPITVGLMYKSGQCKIQSHRLNPFKWMCQNFFYKISLRYMTFTVHVLIMFIVEARTVYFILNLFTIWGCPLFVTRGGGIPTAQCLHQFNFKKILKHSM